MDRKDYDDKVKELGDELTYKVLKKDPTEKTKRDMNGIALKMKRGGGDDRGKALQTPPQLGWSTSSILWFAQNSQVRRPVTTHRFIHVVPNVQSFQARG